MQGLKNRLRRAFYPGFNLCSRSRRTIIRFFLQEPEARTLDIGCGNGFFTIAVAERGGVALGVSFDSAQIAKCRDVRDAKRIPVGRLEFKVMDAGELNALSDRFDQILMLEVLEHIDCDAAVLTNVARLLKPGGLLHITTPDVDRGTWVGVMDRRAAGGHCRIGYSARRLEELLRAAGLDIAYQTRIGSWGDYLTPFQCFLQRIFKMGHWGEGIAFCLVYPVYLFLGLIPIPRSCGIFHHVVARKPAGD